jgi:hypothetical protein
MPNLIPCALLNQPMHTTLFKKEEEYASKEYGRSFEIAKHAVFRLSFAAEPM